MTRTYSSKKNNQVGGVFAIMKEALRNEKCANKIYLRLNYTSQL